MYKLKIVQPRQTNYVLTHQKIILCDSFLNTLFIFISYNTKGRNKTCTSICRVEPLREPIRDPRQHNISCLQDPAFVPPSPRSPLEDPLITTSWFHHQTVHGTTPISLNLRFTRRTPIRCHYPNEIHLRPWRR